MRATLLDSQTSNLEEGLELTASTHVRWFCRYWRTTELPGTPQDESRKGRQNLLETATVKINLLVHQKVAPKLQKSLIAPSNWYIVGKQQAVMISS